MFAKCSWCQVLHRLLSKTDQDYQMPGRAVLWWVSSDSKVVQDVESREAPITTLEAVYPVGA